MAVACVCVRIYLCVFERRNGEPSQSDQNEKVFSCVQKEEAGSGIAVNNVSEGGRLFHDDGDSGSSSSSCEKQLRRK